MWPFGLAYWPLFALLGTVGAWNAFILLSYVGAGGLACWWLRALGLPRAAALAGGLAFAVAPYRAQQSVGHLLGPISMLLPLALLGIEKGGRRWGTVAVVALASIPLSGQVHLALGAIPFVCAYALLRRRWQLAVAAAGAAALAGLLVQKVAIAGSISSGGRTLPEVDFYSAEWRDLLARHARHGPESFVFLGWGTPLVALAGLVLLVVGRRRGLATLLALGAAVPIVLALGTNLPAYAPIWRHFTPFRYPRVPERLMPIAVLCIGALVAFAVARAPRRTAAVGALVVALLLVDLHAPIYGASAADAGNAAYSALRKEPSGRLLELPVFRPGTHYGSVYFRYDLVARRERPGGYSTTAPLDADALAQRLEGLNCGDWSRVDLASLGVRYITLHRGQFTSNSAVPDRERFARLGLERHGWRPVARGGVVSLWERTPGAAESGSLPPSLQPVFCQGWYDSDGSGIAMRQSHAPFWVYGAGTLLLWAMAAEPLDARFSVDEREVSRATIAVPRRIVIPLGKRRGWHIVTIDVAHMPSPWSRRLRLRLLSVVAG